VKKSAPSLSLGVFLGFALLFSLQAVPNLSRNSLTNDEAFEITNGYYYLTQGDVTAEQEHVPLGDALEALPLLFLGLHTLPFAGDSFARSHFFVFVWNQDKLLALTFWPRLVDWLFGLALGFLIFRATRKERPWAFAALALWAFNPMILAMTALAKTDIPATFFFFAAVLIYEKRRNPESRSYFAAGAVSGIAILCKLSCVAILPLFVILDLWNGWKSKTRTQARELWRSAKNWAWLAAGTWLVIGAVYLPGTCLLPGHQWPWGYFIDKFKDLVAFSHRPFPVFFWGAASLHNHWLYFPVSFLLKSPLPFILLIGLGLFLGLQKRVPMPAAQWIPPLVFGLSILHVLNLGIRFYLPAYPFLILIAARAAQWLWIQGIGNERKLLSWTGAGLLVWQAVSVAASFPNHLSYFNDLVPPEKKIFFLADSNLDWGQDHLRLAAVARERGWTKIKLAYFGAADPAAYGLAWEPWREKDLAGPQPGWVYAVNADFLQLGPAFYPSALPIAQSWISQRPPTGKVADSWYYFEIPGNPAADTSPFLPSAPFQQYRGFVPYRPGSRE